MTNDTNHDHELEAEYLSPSDAELLEVAPGDGGLELSVAVFCPECGQTLALDAPVAESSEIDLELPLEDAEDSYDCTVASASRTTSASSATAPVAVANTGLTSISAIASR